jgi:glucan phosphoethanolaminetransferase (alkaline phosphatase superfamily)
MSQLLNRLKAYANEYNIVHRSLALALFYSVFWFFVHHVFTDAKWEPEWFLPQILSSTLIFFTLNGLFVTFSYYRPYRFFQFLVSALYIQPFFNLFYFYTYKTFLEQQNLSLVIREPFFVIKVFAVETTWDRGLILILAIAFYYFVNSTVLYRPDLTHKKIKPYDFFLNKWALLFTVIMIGLQIKWCLDHDPSQLIMRSFYPITLMALVSVIVHLIRTRQPVFVRLFVMFLIFANIIQLYSLNLAFLDQRNKFTLDAQYYRSFFGAFYVQTAFGDMKQNEKAIEKYAELPVAKMDYNILISLNDAQRWDHLSSNGYPRPTDDELYWFYDKSFNFQFPISPANFTDTSVPAILTGLGSDQDVRKIKSSFAIWDYFSKGANTFFVSSQDITWSKLNLFYGSIGQKHVWSATAQPDYKEGNPEDTIDRLSRDHLINYLPTLKDQWVGVWQTFGSHSPYRTEPEYQRYKPCDLTRNSGIENFRNCYLNGQVYSAHVRSDLFKKLDLDKTVIVLTSDHGEGLGEHGVYYHGVDYHQEMVKVPLNIYIPPALQAKIPPEKLANLKENLKKVVSVTDVVPTLLQLHEMVTGQKLYDDLSYYTGKSLFEKWDYRVVFSSHCYPQYRCYSREIMFADDNYFLIFRPSEGFYKIYDTWKDLKQEHPLDMKDVDQVKLRKLVEEAARVHPLGQSMKSYYESIVNKTVK